jgi:phosphohistidine phosphatase
MDLYLLRHGIAVERGSPGSEVDSARPLTAEGIRKTQRVARGMRALDLSFDRILTSPYTRAKETAEIVALELGAQDRLALEENLAPGGNRWQLMESLAHDGEPPTSVLLVGHEPEMSETISMLLCGSTDLAIEMRKAGLCKLVLDKPQYGRCASLVWLLTPRLLAMLA